MPWRGKLARWLRYQSDGKPTDYKARGFKTVLVCCVGPPKGERCWHNAEVPLDRLPDWDWQDICAHLRCTKCGTVGFVDCRPSWSEVIDYCRGNGKCPPN